MIPLYKVAAYCIRAALAATTFEKIFMGLPFPTWMKWTMLGVSAALWPITLIVYVLYSFTFLAKV